MRPSFIFLFLIALIIDLYLIFIYAPVEANQGLVQKIFYFHLSSAFAMYAGFLLSGLFAFLYLIKRKIDFDVYSEAGARVGLLFCTMVLFSGPIWAKPIWGAWWSWDPRLTTTLLIWLIFLSTLLLRKFYELDPKGKIFASILTLFGLLDIPLIFFAVKLWRGIHPSVLGEESNMPSSMKITLIATNVTVLLFFGILFVLESKVLKSKNRLEQLVLY